MSLMSAQRLHDSVHKVTQHQCGVHTHTHTHATDEQPSVAEAVPSCLLQGPLWIQATSSPTVKVKSTAEGAVAAGDLIAIL